MAQLNITLNQDEILQLLSENTGEAFRKLLETSLNSILQVESAEQLKAAPYERSDERIDSRNGSRDRDLVTRIGRITLHVPRHRNTPFKTMIFNEYSRSEAALIAGMTEMVINGVSTRKVSKVVETLCGTSYSKSAVSELCQDLDVAVDEFRNRPLTESYPFLTLDATYFKVRENHRIVSKALLIGYATNKRGIREVVGFGVYQNESNDTWDDFVSGLKKRGLSGLLMITSDAHEGIQHAIRRNYPEVPWQRCQFHFAKNISDKAPKKYRTGLRSELTEMFSSSTIAEARRKRDEIIADYKDISEEAMACLDDGFESAMTAMILPKPLRKLFRTSNQIERLNRELKRRSKVIGVFPNTDSLIRLMGSVLLERNELIQSRKSVFSLQTYQSLMKSGIPSKLTLIAQEQQQLQAA